MQTVDLAVHFDALAAYHESTTTSISFVDRTSFAFMRANRIAEAFAYDPDFERAGFELRS